MHSKEPQYLSVCHTGVVLRVLVGVLMLVGLFCSFGTTSFEVWLAKWVYACMGAVPACLLWLLLVCALSRRVISTWPSLQQQAVVCGLGALAGAYGYAQASMLVWWVNGVPTSLWGWAPPAITGAAMAGTCWTWLMHRQGKQGPSQIQARLDSLQARIRPHFLFNTINTAMALVQADPMRAEEVLQDLAELFRRALASPDAQTPLAEEIDLAKRYLGIEQLRFGDRLRVQWQLDAQVNMVQAPILLLQPLVENAIRHGVEPAMQGGWIEVSTQRLRGRVVITVVNSLPMPQEVGNTSSGHGLALRNVQERLQLLYDIEADFEAGVHPPSGAYAQSHFRVRCSWPA